MATSESLSGSSPVDPQELVAAGKVVYRLLRTEHSELGPSKLMSMIDEYSSLPSSACESHKDIRFQHCDVCHQNGSRTYASERFVILSDANRTAHPNQHRISLCTTCALSLSLAPLACLNIDDHQFLPALDEHPAAVERWSQLVVGPNLQHAADTASGMHNASTLWEYLGELASLHPGASILGRRYRESWSRLSTHRAFSEFCVRLDEIALVRHTWSQLIDQHPSLLMTLIENPAQFPDQLRSLHRRPTGASASAQGVLPLIGITCAREILSIPCAELRALVDSARSLLELPEWISLLDQLQNCHDENQFIQILEQNLDGRFLYCAEDDGSICTRSPYSGPWRSLLLLICQDQYTEELQQAERALASC